MVILVEPAWSIVNATTGQNIFVALTGSDTGGDGSISSPYRTLAKAADKALPGDTIYVRGGLYTGTKEEIGQVCGAASQPITIRPYSGETVIFDGTGAGIGSNESIILISGSSHIIFEGFEVQNSSGRGISIYESYQTTIRNNRIHDVQRRGLGGGGDNLIFEGNEVWRAVLENEGEAMGSGGWAAALSTYKRANNSNSTNITIRNNYIHDSWGEGIIPTYAKGVVIENNIIHDTYSVNIYITRSNDVTIDGNYVYTTTDTYNRSDHGYPAHGISLANEGPSSGDDYINNITIANNLIVGTGAGINYWQSGHSGLENTYHNLKIQYNVITATHSDAIHFDLVDAAHTAPSGVVVKNNIIYAGANGTTLNIGNPGAWTFSYNNWPSGVPALATGPNNFSAPPQFVDPTGGSVTGFKLQSGSSSIGAGTPVNTTVDYWGNFRSLQPTVGIHEFFPAVFDRMIYLPLIRKGGSTQICGGTASLPPQEGEFYHIHPPFRGQVFRWRASNPH